MAKYAFSWNDKASVECPMLDEFMRELIALCARYQIAFDLESGEYSSRLIPTAFSEDSFSIFTENLDDYSGGVPWLDEAKARYRLAEDILRKESDRQSAINNEARERAIYAALKLKYEGKN